VTTQLQLVIMMIIIIIIIIKCEINVAKLRKRQAEFKEVIKVKVNLALEQAMKAQRGSRSVALLFLSRWCEC